MADAEAIYDYTDEHGNLLYQVVRKPGKKFFQRRPDGVGGWIWRKHDRQVLYHLTEVLEAPIVFVVEGERDVETLRSHGFPATTNARGAKAPWLASFTAALRGRDVILIPDNNEPGRLRVLAIARALLGVASNITILELEGAKDITEWFENGHSEVELISMLEAVSHAR
jgi:5S rRNA maturation endonuclease (ribonuclease M5)